MVQIFLPSVAVTFTSSSLVRMSDKRESKMPGHLDGFVLSKNARKRMSRKEKKLALEKSVVDVDNNADQMIENMNSEEVPSPSQQKISQEDSCDEFSLSEGESDDEFPENMEDLKELLEKKRREAQEAEEVSKLQKEKSRLIREIKKQDKRLKAAKVSEKKKISRKSNSSKPVVIDDIRKELSNSRAKKIAYSRMLVDSSSSDDSDSEGELIICSSRKGKRDPRVKFPQHYPEDFLGLELASSVNTERKFEFKDLTLRLLMYGEMCIFAEGMFKNVHRFNWIKKLIFYAGRYEWPAVLQLHKTVIRQVELGYVSWSSDFSSLAVEMLSAYPLSKKFPRKEVGGRSDFVFYCAEFNKASGCNLHDRHDVVFKG